MIRGTEEQGTQSRPDGWGQYTKNKIPEHLKETKVINNNKWFLPTYLRAPLNSHINYPAALHSIWSKDFSFELFSPHDNSKDLDKVQVFTGSTYNYPD